MVTVGVEHTGCPRRLHAVHLALGAQALDGKGHARDQPAAADGHDHRVHILQLVQNFQADGALPGDHIVIVVGVDKGHAGFFLQLHGFVVRIVIGALYQAHLSAQALGAFHLHNGCAVRHAHHAFNAHAGGGQRHALRMVSGAAGHNAVAALFLAELADLIISAAHLKAAGHLQVFGFQIQLCLFTQARSRNQIGFAGYILQHKSGVVDLIQSDHNVTSYPFRCQRGANKKAFAPQSVLPCKRRKLCISRLPRYHSFCRPARAAPLCRPNSPLALITEPAVRAYRKHFFGHGCLQGDKRPGPRTALHQPAVLCGGRAGAGWPCCCAFELRLL